jgi:hypothetical protein
VLASSVTAAPLSTTAAVALSDVPALLAASAGLPHHPLLVPGVANIDVLPEYAADYAVYKETLEKSEG